MSRDFRLFLEDILESCGKVLRFTAQMSFEQFVADEKTYDAVVRNLEIIGEAAKNVPEEVRLRHSDVEWKKIAGLRDVIAHEYFGIDDDILWDIVQNKVPLLEGQVKKVLDGESDL